jgi:hypothetical protein
MIIIPHHEIVDHHHRHHHHHRDDDADGDDIIISQPLPAEHCQSGTASQPALAWPTVFFKPDDGHHHEIIDGQDDHQPSS